MIVLGLKCPHGDINCFAYPMLGSFRMAVGGNLKGIICNIPAKLDLVGSAMFIDDNLCLFCATHSHF